MASGAGAGGKRAGDRAWGRLGVRKIRISQCCSGLRAISIRQEWIAKHKTIDGVLKAIDTSKHPPPDPFNHDEIHAFFKEPEITPVAQLQEQVQSKMHQMQDIHGRTRFYCPCCTLLC